MNTISRVAAVALLAGSTAACSQHEINTFDRYCESLRGVDLAKKYQPFWSSAFVVSFDANAIRDDYSAALNEQFMRDLNLEDRAPRMVWRDGTSLHLTNPSSYFQIDPTNFINEWRSGLTQAAKSQLIDSVAVCRFGAAARLFDQITIHSRSTTVGLELDTDDVTHIPTDRRNQFDWVPN